MQQLGIFAKYWEAGQVKTRLAKTEGSARAAALYHEFLRTSLQRFAGVADKSVVAYTPGDRRDDFANLAGGDWELRRQSDGDLGQRMQHFFHDALRDRDGRVVLVGADTPTLPLELINEAFAALDTHRAVLGPTTDGGYYLVGLSRCLPEIFDGIPWSTAAVWSQTVAQLEAFDIPFYRLAAWYDVDDHQSFAQLRQELTGQLAHDSKFADLRQVVLGSDSR
ncbi:MAG: TIGR04282 family arsenosugar biosynthesis glycosyltransferase [Pirellulales bacterium]